jgi:mannose-6-phosphate isomerase
LEAFVAQVMERFEESRVSGNDDLEWVAGWLNRLHDVHGADPGLLGFLLLEPVRLSPGEALFLEPRKLHAYLSGLALEVMASSDNVLRGGLTPKHVDPEELCRILDFSPSETLIVQRQVVDRGAVAGQAGAREGGGRESEANEGVAVSSWEAPVEDFRLLHFDLTGGETQLAGPSMVLVTRGSLTLRDEGQSVLVRAGAQAFFGADGPGWVSGDGEFYCATVPQA